MEETAYLMFIEYFVIIDDFPVIKFNIIRDT